MISMTKPVLLLIQFLWGLLMMGKLIQAATEKGRPRSVIIVGAGAASIKLAHTLSSASSSSSSSYSIDGLTTTPPLFRVTILEANEYVGGRVRSASFEGHTVELGANWISGRETAFENPIWQLAKEIELQGHPSDRENLERILVMNCNKNSCDEDKAADVTAEYLRLVERFDTIYAKAVQNVASSVTTGQVVSPSADQSVRSILEANGWTPKDQLTDLERSVEHNVLEVWVADSLAQLSGAHDMKPGANDVDLGQDELFVEDSRGFNSIFRGMVDDLQKDGSTRIHLGQEVEEIHYSPGNVKVVSKDLSTGKRIEHEADMVVSTVSLGVLQSEEAIEFVPPFPEWKTKALNEIKMFNFAKVYAKFRRRLWPEAKDYLVFVSEGEDRRGHYPFWMKYKNTKDNLLMCYLGGAQARRVESLDEEQIKDEIECLFRQAFGDHKDCRPESVAVTDWSRNPRFYGSYSYFPKDAFATVSQEDLWRGLDGVGDITTDTIRPTTLYFAGEAFDDKFNGWVQGGFLSGERTARMILQDHHQALQNDN
jgi:polyamine oxidase